MATMPACRRQTGITQIIKDLAGLNAQNQMLYSIAEPKTITSDIVFGVQKSIEIFDQFFILAVRLQ